MGIRRRRREGVVGNFQGHSAVCPGKLGERSRAHTREQREVGRQVPFRMNISHHGLPRGRGEIWLRVSAVSSAFESWGGRPTGHHGHFLRLRHRRDTECSCSLPESSAEWLLPHEGIDLRARRAVTQHERGTFSVRGVPIAFACKREATPIKRNLLVPIRYRLPPAW